MFLNASLRICEISERRNVHWQTRFISPLSGYQMDNYVMKPNHRFYPGASTISVMELRTMKLTYRDRINFSLISRITLTMPFSCSPISTLIMVLPSLLSMDWITSDLSANENRISLIRMLGEQILHTKILMF